MTFGPIYFDSPVWLMLVPASWALVWWISRRSLPGLGRRTRWVAFGIRLLVIALVCAAIAEPSWRDENEGVAVIFVPDLSRSMPADIREVVSAYAEAGAKEALPGDRMGLVTTAEEAFVQALPSERTRSLDFDFVGGTEGTDLAGGIGLALAIKPTDAATRFVLVTDANETTGSLLGAARMAKAAGVPIDVLPVSRSITHEIMLDRLISPTTARRGQPMNVRFVVESTHAVRARLTLLANGSPVDLDPDSAGVSAVLGLARGTNVHTVPLTLPSGGPQRFEAVIEALEEGSDTIVENNRALAVTFVTSEGRTLMYCDDVVGAGALIGALRDAGIDLEVRPTASAHESLVELGAYDALVLVDVSAYSFTQQQQEEMRSYVHDLGGGLVMVGGPNSFGAGGWIGSPLADVLPVKLDPPQRRNMPRGALALVMHSCEIPNGNYWGQQTAQAAVNALSRLDIVGVLEYDWNNAGTGASWAQPLTVKGDGSAAARAIKNLKFGDMPDFDAALKLALGGLVNVRAGQKHCIIISDGDPSGPAGGLIKQFVDNQISISTVAVFPHMGGASNPDLTKMKNIAIATGGRYYQILSKGQLATLPQIFVKEAQTVKRALIWEGDPFVPDFSGGLAEAMRGIGPALPPISGYVVTAEREGLSLVTATGPEKDPIIAQWQHGLGRSVAFMSDATSRWDPAWLTWGQFGAFWEQHVRWAMRPSGSANVSVYTKTEGERTKVVVEALDEDGERMNFARFRGRLVRPDMTATGIELHQTGAGRYEGVIDSGMSGSYVMSLRYDALRGDGSGELVSGTVQAAVTRPFADEHRALGDNIPLLRQVAEMTGGKVLGSDPASAGLFRRDGLVAPVSKRSIWALVAALGMTVFLLDVAVRRVRVDVVAMAHVVRGAFMRKKEAEGAQIGALKAAREKARGRMDERAPEGADAVRGVKIEAGDDAGVSLGSPIESAPRRVFEVPKKNEAAAAGDEEEGMSRLMRAKRRARDAMREDDEKNNG